MTKSLWKSPIVAAVAIAALAAGTALVAGYVDKPNQATEVAAEGKCGECPRKNTEECCKVTGTCANPDNCEGDCLAEAGAGSCSAKEKACCGSDKACCGQEKPPAGACPISGCDGQEKAPAGACPISGAEGPVQSPCGAGAGCTLTK